MRRLRTWLLAKLIRRACADEVKAVLEGHASARPHPQRITWFAEHALDALENFIYENVAEYAFEPEDDR